MSESPESPGSPPPQTRRSHFPTNPSRLRVTTTSSLENDIITEQHQESSMTSAGRPQTPPLQQASTAQAVTGESELLLDDEDDEGPATIIEPSGKDSDERTALLEQYHHNRVCGLRNCNHGTFSPRAPSIASTNFDSIHDHVNRELGGDYHGTDGDPNTPMSYSGHSFFGDQLGDTLPGRKGMRSKHCQTKFFGTKSPRFVYFSYYFPFARWITQYRWVPIICFQSWPYSARQWFVRLCLQPSHICTVRKLSSNGSGS
jgi:hypothetical protein